MWRWCVFRSFGPHQGLLIVRHIRRHAEGERALLLFFPTGIVESSRLSVVPSDAYFQSLRNLWVRVRPAGATAAKAVLCLRGKKVTMRWLPSSSPA